LYLGSFFFIFFFFEEKGFFAGVILLEHQHAAWEVEEAG